VGQQRGHVSARPRRAAAGTLGRAGSERLSRAKGYSERSGLGAGPAGERLGTILLRLGYVQPMHLVRALCDQAGVVDFLVFGRYVVEPPLARLIPRPLAHDLAVLPLVRLPQANYLVASGSPLSGLALARLQRRLRGPVEPILVREPDFHRAIDLCYDALQRRGTAPVRLGEILVRDRLVQAGEVARALGEVHRTGRPLGEVLVRRGLLDEGAVYLLLARQRGLRLVSAREVVDPREAAPLVERLPRGYVRHNQVIPYRRTGASVLAVTSDPNLDTTCLAEALSCQHVTLQLAPKSEMAHLVEETCRLAAG
jgi:hypothetical protein